MSEEKDKTVTLEVKNIDGSKGEPMTFCAACLMSLTSGVDCEEHESDESTEGE